jgi:hypothetical protein
VLDGWAAWPWISLGGGIGAVSAMRLHCAVKSWRGAKRG